MFRRKTITKRKIDQTDIDVNDKRNYKIQKVERYYITTRAIDEKLKHTEYGEYYKKRIKENEKYTSFNEINLYLKYEENFLKNFINTIELNLEYDKSDVEVNEMLIKNIDHKRIKCSLINEIKYLINNYNDYKEN